MEDRAKGRVSDSSADSQSKEFEFSDDLNKLARSDEDSSDSDRDKKKATQEKHVQSRPLMRLTEFQYH